MNYSTNLKELKHIFVVYKNLHKYVPPNLCSMCLTFIKGNTFSLLNNKY